MRLISATLRNYRLHRERTVEFDPSLTLVGGPNESGKSTLAEAVHRAMFLPHRRGGKDQKAMCPRHESGTPEVELVFEQGSHRYTLRKHFKGPAGSIELRDDAHGTWTGDEAEERLARILGYEKPVAPSQAAAQWAHLWIRQGESAGDPSDPVSAETDKLLPLLQQQGGAALMQSQLDQRIADEFRRRAESVFNKNGSTKAGSPLSRAEEALEQARQLHEQRRQSADQLARASEDHESAARDEAQARALIPELDEQLEAGQAKLKQAEQTAARKKQVDEELATAEQGARETHKMDARIRELQRTIGPMRKDLAPRRESVTAAEREHGELAERSTRQRREHEAANHELTQARAHKEALEIDARVAEAKAEQAQVKKRLGQAEKLRRELVDPREAIARLPGIEDQDVEALRKLDSSRDRASSAIEAIATGLEWLEGPGPVTIDDTRLEAGTPHTITTAGILEVAGHRIRIRPGGGRRLDEARLTLEQCEGELTESLRRAGVTTVAEAIRARESRRELDSRIQKLEIQLEALQPEQLTRDRERLEARVGDLEGRLARLRNSLTDPGSAPSSLPDAERVLEAATERESGCRTALETLRKQHEASAQRLESTRQALRDAESKIQETESQLAALVEVHGDDETRRLRVAGADRKVEDLRQSSRDLTELLARQSPADLARDVERARRSLGQQREALKDANTRRIRAATLLESDGSSDPHAALAEAADGLRRAQEEQALEERRAAAVRRLADLFRDEQQQLSNQLTEPLVKRISDYLRCIFGPEVKARLSLRDGDFQGLALVRPSGEFPFEDLSGGTREQLAAAVRLAATELLAASHDGCLPLVFDDAFTHSDPERTRTLQRMLDLAASRGLQVIVLSCNPGDYASLGARLVRLEPETSRTDSGA